MATGEKKLRQMEEEMNRFEAEIAHQVTVSIASSAPAAPTAPLTGGFAFPTATAFVPHQLRVTPAVPGKCLYEFFDYTFCLQFAHDGLGCDRPFTQAKCGFLIRALIQITMDDLLVGVVRLEF
ncbi:hypothetical protein D915_010467 [Fasciola hepatica]|uniref:Uncharacterized protein n=1 Tax=Fasciola hepatica TaxID=6192 RepID=A0A4E0RPY7_FASHE|nr:hypothetical protein D915_010467 [Fasciola hepatica]